MKNNFTSIKRYLISLKEYFFVKRNLFFVFGVLILAILIYLVPKSFALLQPVKSIEIYSEKLNYQNKEPGAWKVTKTAKWVSVHEAEITFNVDSILKSNNTQRDVILVLDNSGSMAGDKLSRVKLDTTELVENLLEDTNNKIALITFNTSSQIDSGFTNDKTSLIDKINSLEADGATNYYQALVNVDSLLKNYTKEEGRECIILFLTDGYPCEDTPNEVGEYKYLKDQYSYISLNAIQYEMGVNITDEIKNISDNQFMADMKTLNNVLFDASITPIVFDAFKITDYIDTNYFYVEDEKNISITQGKIKFDKNSQKVEALLDGYKSGSHVTMTIKAKLKKDLDDIEKIYPTNEQEEIISKIESTEENITSKKTPVLADNYKVIYDGNAPEGCNISNTPKTKNYSVFETVPISDEAPVCRGYQFKGWEYVRSSAKKINDDYFIMPEEDVNIKGTWSKLDISMSMDGTVKESLTLYKQVQEDLNNPDKQVRKYTGDTSTFNGSEDVYYYYGAAKNNNVLFANYCWKIVRTTDTGGVKLIYNGVPSAGKCNNTGNASQLTAAQMGTDSDEVLFNTNRSSPADVGYMYNQRDVSSTYYLNDYNLNNSGSILVMTKDMGSGSEFNFYYADSVDRSSFFPSLKNPKQYVWSSSYNILAGKYTCLQTNSSSSIFMYKVIKTTPTKMFYVSLGVKEYANFSLATNYKTNSDGTYSLVNPITISKISWIDNYSKYLNYYACSGGENTTCSDMFQIGNINSSMPLASGYKISSAFKYSNSFVYSNGKYTLKNSKSIWNIYDGSLANYHYTCLDKTDSCSEIKYIYQFDDRSGYLYYLTLKNGDSIEQSLNKMLSENTHDSVVKMAVDYWYSNNMTKYTPYLEDTVWCNDRSISSLGSGFNSNGGQVNDRDLSASKISFSLPTNNNLTCKNISDRFTVTNSNGNGLLRYPVGLLTEQESSLTISDLHGNYWTMTPLSYSSAGSLVNRVTLTLTNTAGVRPTISLKPDILYSTGDGSIDSPYVILTD